jgi:selenide,water dikinase
LIIGHAIASSTGGATGTGPGSSKSVFLIFGEFVMDVEVPVRLTALASCGGCASKLGSAELASVLQGLPSTVNDRVLVGFGTADDAGVFVLRDDLALVQTVDFFTPIVDDPYDFGSIAATNAISDVYAMGGTPVTALNIVAFPEGLDLAILSRILAGGADVARAAGVAILGGHTIKDDEPKYGMAVSGTIDPRRIVTNANAKPGDVLVLTKPIGTGILTTAAKRDTISYDALRPAIEWMTTLNAGAGAAMLEAQAHAATDITGFGILGHGGELARASGVGLAIDANAVPIMDGVLDLIRADVVPSGTRNNARTHATFTTFDASVDEALRVALSDAQTSGGLLISIAPERLDVLRRGLRAAGVLDAVIGTVTEGEGIRVA